MATVITYVYDRVDNIENEIILSTHTHTHTVDIEQPRKRPLKSRTSVIYVNEIFFNFHINLKLSKLNKRFEVYLWLYILSIFRPTLD